MGTRRCAYQGKKIHEIESEWIKNKIKDKVELDKRIELIERILGYLRDKANCRFDAIEGKEFCIFHDPDYWKTNEKEVREKFLEELNKGESYFVGFHLPAIVELPKVIEQPLYMELTKIHGLFVANGTHFNGEARFNGTWFNEATSFNKVLFKGKASFSGAWFNEVANFGETQFNEEAWFDKIRFNKAVNFGRVWFNETASFDGSQFNGKAWFAESQFNKRASFYRAWFNGEAWFNEVRFDGEIKFDEAQFNKIAWFIKVQFNGIVSFDKSSFRSKTIFDGSFFSGDVSFKNTIFLIGSINNSKYTDYISFRRVTFNEPEKVIFDGCNMKRVSFLHSDVSRIKFINTKWGKDFRIFDEKLFLLKLNKKEFIKEQKKFLKKIISVKLDDIIKAFERRNVTITEEMEEIIYEPTINQILEKLPKGIIRSIIEENKNEVGRELKRKYEEYIEKLKEKLKTINQDLENEIMHIIATEDIIEDIIGPDLTLDNVLTVYRNLRENYDYYMKYEESGKFFLNEMKLKRKTLPKLSGEKIVMLLYEVLSLYGESYIRPLLTLIAIIMTSFLIRLYLHQFDPNVLFDELLKSIDLFGLGSASERGSVSGSIDIIERLAAIPILGMLIVALRRKLERRVRH
jgi:hypothetical protein